MKIRLEVWHYRCGLCGTQYDGLELPDGTYGEFLLRSKPSGDMAFLNALFDKVFTELNEIIKSFYRNKNLTDMARSDILQSVFWISCDKSPKNEYYFLNAMPPCPKCGNTERLNYNGPVSPKIKDCDLPKVTHYEWKKLTTQKKELALKRALEEIKRT